MTPTKDKRINASFLSFKEYVIFFVILLVVCCSYNSVYFLYREAGEANNNLIVAAAMFGNLIFTCFAVCIIFAFFRKYYFGRPMKHIGDAARRIAEGDFYVRIEPLRKDGKKDEIEVMIEDFNKMADELSSIETMKGDFIANVSHEIKSPLSVIQSYAMALQNDNLPTDVRREYSETIVTASRKLSDLVSNILKLNKLENQEIFPASDPYELGEQLRYCSLSFEELWEKKNIDFRADIDDVSVCYDENLLELVWNNLISNAIKFTDEGGTIEVSLKAGVSYAIVTVKDTGCGMNEKNGAHIFDKFYQGDTSHSREGNGLGLALVKKVIDVVSGDISVESRLGKGTQFTVRLKI
ncbi:HAMP domain-containing sensor histidine kinase [Oceanirhabdus seepicola]|uniref:histidine kinase n=1 Tax=Oceanirhabdus seepicola TaxID=2828781 RepID=A0A9J6P5A1_9CLOT|nr:HAMP domain-containing sensor histidine kinase [Oceanirhabdus seepicola]MCM1991428.1 HAMP domain-containing histidine kinase [Oceanirhabdus seepicola]